MDIILSNIRVMAPFVIAPWLVLLIFVIRGRQRFRNSFVLMIALMMTAFFVCGLFGSHMVDAMIVLSIFIICVIMLVPIMLFINGIVMLKKEGRSMANLLSLFMGIAVGIGEVAYLLNFYYNGTQQKFEWYGYVVNLVGGTAMYLCLVFVAFMVYAVFVAYIPPIKEFDYVIIHGCGLIGGERVSKLLSQRIDRGIKIYNKQKNKPIIIPSGGRGSDEKLSEAHAMALYMIDKGIPEDHIIEEGESTTTLYNIKNSKRIIDERGGGRVALVSSNYHVYRCLTLAKQTGLNCIGFGSNVARYYFPSALIREFIAVFSEKRMLIWTVTGWVFLTLLPSMVYFGLI